MILNMRFLSNRPAYLSPADIWYHEHQPVGPAMWGFTAENVTIYSTDGSKILKVVEPGVSPFDVQSDGHKYIWAASTQGYVNVYSIDTGDFVTSIPSCSTPLTLDYVPNREEVWLRCAQPESDEEGAGHIDSFSVNNIGAETKKVLLFNNSAVRGYGRHVVDSALGSFGYATVYNNPFLYKFDLVTREVVDEFLLEDSHGAYDAAFSAVNKHVYLRARVCCTCGDDNSDLGGSCPENRGNQTNQPVEVLTGPNA